MKEAVTRFTTDALVIKEMNVGESDRLVTLFTRDYGIIRAFASGTKNLKSKKASGTSLLTFSSVSVAKRGDTYKIYEAQPIRMFFKAGSDIIRLSVSQYFCELALELAPAGTPNEELLRLILNSLHFLTEDGHEPALIKAITELRAASVSGYMPNLVACCGCGKFEDDIMRFDLLNGQLYCSDCRSTGEYVNIDRTLLTAMRHIIYSEFKNLYSFTIPDKSAKLLSDITGRYITAQTEHRFSTLDFYNSVKE